MSVRGSAGDFAVRYDPDKDTIEDVTDRILYALFIKRIKGQKPVIAFISGDSGEGKSYLNLELQRKLLLMQGINLIDFVNDINVYTPLQYPQKIDKLLYDDRLKKVNIICMHEAREIVKAKLWHSFLTQSVADINSMSRTIKRLMVFITSQFIRDISTDIRYTLNYYIKVSRIIGGDAKADISLIWKDDSDLEKPKLRKRRIWGWLVYPNGRYRKFIPRSMIFRLPPKEITKEFNQQDFDSKSVIIKKKVEKLMIVMNLENGGPNTKLEANVEFYASHPELLQEIGQRYKNGKWKIKADAMRRHDFTSTELKEFEAKLNDKMKERFKEISDEVNEDGEL